jgi:hypothetical protein
VLAGASRLRGGDDRAADEGPGMKQLPKFRGSELPQAKLNERLVAMIRAEHAEKERQKRELDRLHSAEAIAKRYQVSVNTITKVLTYATWRHVQGAA